MIKMAILSGMEFFTLVSEVAEITTASNAVFGFVAHFLSLDNQTVKFSIRDNG
jgi:hypothetical protein